MRLYIPKSITRAVLAIGLLVTGFTASAAAISLLPSSQSVGNGATFSVDIMASALPTGTSGGWLNISWTAADMTLNNVFMATTDPADSNGGTFLGPWDPTSSGFSSPGTIGSGALSNLQVGAFFGVSGDQPIARLNFTLGSSVVNSQIYVATASGGDWSAYDGVNPPYNFSPTYSGAIINPTLVPVPAAIWLFGSGLFGLAGVATRRRG
jgi:hypothetical protein